MIPNGGDNGHPQNPTALWARTSVQGFRKDTSRKKPVDTTLGQRVDVRPTPDK